MNVETHTEPMQDISAATLLSDLMSISLDELKNAGDVWHRLNEEEQDKAIERIEIRTKDAIRQAVALIATGGYTRVPAKLESLTVKDGVKCVLKVGPADQHRHELFDAQGSSCLIVLADAEDFIHPHEHKPDADQLGLALGGIAGSDEAQPDSD